MLRLFQNFKFYTSLGDIETELGTVKEMVDSEVSEVVEAWIAEP